MILCKSSNFSDLESLSKIHPLFLKSTSETYDAVFRFIGPGDQTPQKRKSGGCSAKQILKFKRNPRQKK